MLSKAVYHCVTDTDSGSITNNGYRPYLEVLKGMDFI